MPTQVSESFILRTYPFREADLIVSFLPGNKANCAEWRAGHASRRVRSGRGWSGCPMCGWRIFYGKTRNWRVFRVARRWNPALEYRRITAARSRSTTSPRSPTTCCRAHEPNEKFFRLIKALIDHLRAGGEVWSAVDYFTLWAVRLTGVLPEIRVSDETAALGGRDVRETAERDSAAHEWNKSTMSMLRRSLVRAMEQHVERRMLTVPLLEAL